MTSPEATVRRPEVGDPAPKFNLPAFPSGNISLDDYIGKKNETPCAPFCVAMSLEK